jgi:hypothetical protein
MYTYSIGSCDADYPCAMALVDAAVMRLSFLRTRRLDPCGMSGGRRR